MENVVYTALFGPYEELKTPRIITPGWRYICYTDQPLTSDVWEIVPTKVRGTDPQRFARWFKIMHWVDWAQSIWVDASFCIDTDLNDWWNDHSKAPFSCAQHPLRQDFYEECMDCIVSKRGDRIEVDAQMNEYLAAGVPRHNGVIQSGILLRTNSLECIALCEAWWSEMQGRSSRDQIAFCRVSAKTMPGLIYNYRWDYRMGKDFIYWKHKYLR